MRLLLAAGIYPPDIGGPATFTQELAIELQRRGHQVIVLCYGEQFGQQDEGLDVIRISRTGGALVRYLRYSWNAFWFARSADLLFAQGPVSEGLPATLAARLLRKPIVMKIVGDFAWEIANQEPGVESLDEFITKKHQGKIGLLEQIERWTAKHAQRIFVPSEYLRRVVTKWGLPAEQIQVIYNTSPILPISTLSKEAWLEQHALTGKKILLYVGRLVSWKRIDFLLAVLQSLDDTFHFVIAGDGPMLEEWTQLAQQLGVANRVHFVGRTDRLQTAQWFRAADLFLLSSTYEGLSHVLLEALSVGLPCVVSDAGGNPEIKQIAPETVNVLPLDDHVAWKEAIISLVGQRGQGMRWQTAEQMHQAYVDALIESVKS